MAVDQQLIKGSISIMILKLLDYSDMYGYQIIKELDRRSASTFILKEGTLYPVLHSLENQDCIESYWEDTTLVRKRRYYHLTSKGQKLLESKEQEWSIFSDAVDKVLGADDRRPHPAITLDYYIREACLLWRNLFRTFLIPCVTR